MIHGLDGVSLEGPELLVHLERHIARVEEIIARAEQSPRGLASMQLSMRRSQLRSLKRQAETVRQELGK